MCVYMQVFCSPSHITRHVIIKCLSYHPRTIHPKGTDKSVQLIRTKIQNHKQFLWEVISSSTDF